jgi:hypothetical protein
MTNLLTPLREPQSSSPTRVKQQLKELNQEFFPARTALNQAAIALDHAMKALDTSYQRKRAHILNGHGQDRSEL